MPQSLQRMATLIENFNSLRITRRSNRMVRMADFFTTYLSLRFQEISIDQGVATFNVFKLLGIGSDEVSSAELTQRRDKVAREVASRGMDTPMLMS